MRFNRENAAAKPLYDSRLEYEFGVFDTVVKELEGHILPESASLDDKIRHFRAAVDSFENIILKHNLSMECTDALDVYLCIWSDDLNTQVETPLQKKSLQIATAREDLICAGRRMMETADFSNDAVSDTFEERVLFHAKGGIEAFHAVKESNPQIPSHISSLLTFGIYSKCMEYADASLSRTFRARALFRKHDVPVQDADCKDKGGVQLDSKHYPYAWVKLNSPSQGTTYHEFANAPDAAEAYFDIAKKRAEKIFSNMSSVEDDAFIADVLALERDTVLLSKRSAPTLSGRVH